MGAVAFDTLKFANRLKDAGVPDKQAEAESLALAEVFEVNLRELATKDDLRSGLSELDAKIDKVAATLDAKIDKVAATLDAKIDKTSASLEGKIERVSAVMDMLKWMMALVLGAVLTMLVKMFA
jgi:hypothetical protein